MTTSQLLHTARRRRALGLVAVAFVVVVQFATLGHRFDHEAAGSELVCGLCIGAQQAKAPPPVIALIPAAALLFTGDPVIDVRCVAGMPPVRRMSRAPPGYSHSRRNC